MTLFEYAVLVEAEMRYDKLRQQVVSKRAEMVGKLQELGYGPDDLCLADPNIPMDVREWLTEYKRHLHIKGKVEKMREDVTGQKDRVTLGRTLLASSCSHCDAKPRDPITNRIRNFGRTSDEISFKATLYDLLVYQEAERQYFELRKQIVSQRDEMLGRLHKMEYDMDDMDDMDEMDEINMNDPDIPSDVREWLEKYEQHNLMRTNCYRLKAQVFGEPRVGASQELGEGQAHAASLEETLRSRRGLSPDSSSTPTAADSASDGSKKEM
ncbi:g7606 [Coccomyxa viridis]|uniref:G7606 protein n=1 Tax=Coccomyxa viridis TaxID=1274662 RepID=A0ABP1G2B1_9CHLO